MTIVVEDGTGKPDANSYVAVADADAYFGNVANAAWAAAAQADKEAALIRATMYVDTYTFKYRPLTLNCVDGSVTQALQWPRVNTWGKPVSMKPITQATCEAAVRALAGDLMPDIDPGVIASQTVGPVSVSYSAQRNGGRKRYAIVDLLLRPVLASGPHNMELVRA